MPFYEYKCLECNKIFEVRHGINDDPPETIEECEKEECHLEKLISQVNFRVSGHPKNPWSRSGYANFGTGKDYLNDLE